jgi:hypothetical protein
MKKLSELPPRLADALTGAMAAGEQVLLVTRPSPRHAWGDGEVSMAQSVRARALVGVVRVGLAGPVALQFLVLIVSGPVLILRESGFTLSALAWIVLVVLVVGAMLAMTLYVAGAALLWIWHAAHCTFGVSSHAASAIRDRGDSAVVRRTTLPPPREISVCRLRRSGVGDVVLDHGSVVLPGGEGSEDRTVDYDVGLLSVPDAEKVAATMREAARVLSAARRADTPRLR